MESSELKEFWQSLTPLAKSNMAIRFGVTKSYLSQVMNGHAHCGEMCARKIIAAMGSKAIKSTYKKLRGQA